MDVNNKAPPKCYSVNQYNYVMENMHTKQTTCFVCNRILNRNNRWIVYIGQQRKYTCHKCNFKLHVY